MPQFFTHMATIMDKFNSPHRLIGCDFNLCFDVDIDKRGTSYNNDRSLRVMKDITEENFMIDSWSAKTSSRQTFTWRCEAPSKAMSRLDYFIVTTGSVGWFSEIEIKPGFRSDHSYIYMEFDPIEAKREPGFWRFNTLLLEDSDFINQINEMLTTECDRNQDLEPDQLWELLKVKIAQS